MRRQLGVGLSMLGFGVFRIALLMGRRQLAFGKFGVRPTRWWSKRASNCWPPGEAEDSCRSQLLGFYKG